MANENSTRPLRNDVNHIDFLTQNVSVSTFLHFFIVSRVPANGSDALLQGVEWLPLNENSTRHLVIDVNLTMNHSDFLAERMAFWDLLILTASSSARVFHVTRLSIVSAIVMIMMK